MSYDYQQDNVGKCNTNHKTSRPHFMSQLHRQIQISCVLCPPIKPTTHGLDATMNEGS